MASGQTDSQVYQRTRDTLGKIIKKPPLNDKLLSRPPFKYLRDIILEVSKSTVFFKGLYSGMELDTKTDWDRELKISFLQKAIDVVCFTTKKTVKARPSKIIAGAEVEKTNEFLQLLGIAILKKMDSSEAVQKVLKGEKPSQQTDKAKHKEAKKHNDAGGKESEKKSGENDLKEEEKENNSVSSAPAVQTPPVERPQNRPSTRRKGRDTSKMSKNDTEPQKDDGLASDGSGSQVKIPERPTSAKGGRKGSQDKQGHSSPPLEKGLEETSDHDTHSPPASSNAIVSNGLVPYNTRPSSARPPAPRVVTKVSANTDEDQSRMSSGHDRVPPNVILDNEEEDDDDEFVQQSSNVPSMLPNGTEHNITDNQDIAASKPEGALAKTILETKERFVGEEGMNNERNKTVKDITIDEAQRKREREVVKKEVKTLQESIQSLCQSANPLGKMMDYVQEDLDSMYQELEMWRKENASHAEALRREEKITEEELGPLQTQLAELEEKVIEQFDLISNMKLTIMRNEEQMKSLVMSNH